MIKTDRLYAIALLTNNSDLALRHLTDLNPDADMLDIIDRLNADAARMTDDD